jgi:hypothetical protein
MTLLSVSIGSFGTRDGKIAVVTGSGHGIGRDEFANGRAQQATAEVVRGAVCGVKACRMGDA